MKAKKSLGQNFLKGELALQKITEAGEIKESDIILEIGPGKGALTQKLLEKSRHVIAVEKDRELFEFLQTKFAREIKSGSLVLVHGDILEFDVTSMLPKFSSGPRKKSPDHSENLRAYSYKIIANIPYNITGTILKKFLTDENQPERMVLMVQKEVAERIVGREKESILSISVKAYGEPRMIMKVGARYFRPAPKVDSAIIAISNISRKTFENEGLSEEKFWGLVKAGFAHKRKKLSGNLKRVIPIEELSKSGLGDKRAEDLRLSEWIALSKI